MSAYVIYRTRQFPPTWPRLHVPSVSQLQSWPLVWAVADQHPQAVLASGFSSRAEAQAWIEKQED